MIDAISMDAKRSISTIFELARAIGAGPDADQTRLVQQLMTQLKRMEHAVARRFLGGPGLPPDSVDPPSEGSTPVGGSDDPEPASTDRAASVTSGLGADAAGSTRRARYRGATSRSRSSRAAALRAPGCG